MSTNNVHSDLSTKIDARVKFVFDADKSVYQSRPSPTLQNVRFLVMHAASSACQLLRIILSSRPTLLYLNAWWTAYYTHYRRLWPSLQHYILSCPIHCTLGLLPCSCTENYTNYTHFTHRTSTCDLTSAKSYGGFTFNTHACALWEQRNSSSYSAII